MKSLDILLKRHPYWEMQDIENGRYFYYQETVNPITEPGANWVVDQAILITHGTGAGQNERTTLIRTADYEEALQVFITGNVEPKGE